MFDRVIRKTGTILDLKAENRNLKTQLKDTLKLMRSLIQANAKLKAAADKQAATVTELKKGKAAAESKVKKLLTPKAKGNGTNPEGPATVKGHGKWAQPQDTQRAKTAPVAARDPHELRRMIAHISSPTLA
eukprot:7368385-Pyramimonas_sp.AAC.1